MHEQTIAIIDDNTTIVSFLQQLLDDEGYRTVSDTHGMRAHALVRRELPDLVILDLWMERQETGWDVLRQIRADARPRKSRSLSAQRMSARSGRAPTNSAPPVATRWRSRSQSTHSSGKSPDCWDKP